LRVCVALWSRFQDRGTPLPFTNPKSLKLVELHTAVIFLSHKSIVTLLYCQVPGMHVITCTYIHISIYMYIYMYMFIYCTHLIQFIGSCFMRTRMKIHTYEPARMKPRTDDSSERPTNSELPVGWWSSKCVYVDSCGPTHFGPLNFQGPDEAQCTQLGPMGVVVQALSKGRQTSANLGKNTPWKSNMSHTVTQMNNLRPVAWMQKQSRISRTRTGSHFLHRPRTRTLTKQHTPRAHSNSSLTAWFSSKYRHNETKT
jgi:hypothetical protein